MRKTELAIERCKTISTIQKILGGKWKIEILYYIAIRDIHRFGELRRHIGEITDSSLTDLGESFIAVLNFMKTWGDEHLTID